MCNFKAFLFIFISVGIFVSCEPSSDLLASESVRAGQILCNPFSSKGFQGVLSVNSSENNFSYESNTSILSFYDVPDSFKTQRNTYIQLYAVNYGNKSSFSEEALEIDVLNLRNNNYISITSYIDHSFIQNENYGLNEFFSDHSFIVKNTSGWKVLFIGLFNENDAPILSTQVLIPPFEANPYIYEENTDNRALSNIHPFNNLKTNIEQASDDVFLSRAQAACRENPV